MHRRAGCAPRAARAPPAWPPAAAQPRWPACRARWRSIAISQRRQQLGLMLADQRMNQLVQIAIHNMVELVERQVDTVIGHPALREVVGADPLGAIARTHQALACGGFLGVLLLRLLV